MSDNKNWCQTCGSSLEVCKVLRKTLGSHSNRAHTMSDTLKLFEIEYQDDSGDSPVFTWRTKAYDAEHAEMKFYDFDSEGWVILKIREIGPCGGACGSTEHSRMASGVAGTAPVSHTAR